MMQWKACTPGTHVTLPSGLRGVVEGIGQDKTRVCVLYVDGPPPWQPKSRTGGRMSQEAMRVELLPSLLTASRGTQ